jgi:hypothetical protein
VDASWLVAGGIVVSIVVGVWLLFRSFRRWRQPPPGRDAESRAAEARLWSTLNTNRR